MAQLDVFDFLRPDRREAGDGARAGGAAQERAAAFRNERRDGPLLAPARLLFNSTLPAGLPLGSGFLLMTVSLRAILLAHIAEIGVGPAKFFLGLTGVALRQPRKKLEI
jgi:hypothetical protein